MRKTPVTLGVLGIIFGAFVTLYDGGRLALTAMAGSLNKTLGAAMSSTPRAPGAPDPAVMMERSQALAKQLQPYTMSLMAIMVLFSVALILIGIGLYKRRSAARSAALGWSVLGLLYLAADAIVHFTIILPRVRVMLDETFAAMPNGRAMAPMMQVVGGAQSGFVVLGEVCLAVFPIVLIILLGRRSAAGDFVD
jgi:hypothetical protein